VIERATILIADDSPVVRAVVRDGLEAEGHLVHEADDGVAAIAMCRDLRPDAVLLDIEMPGLDGREVLEQLKNDAELREIPVVFLTGRTGTDDLVAGLRAGAHDYLRKPFEPAELLARIGSAVRNKRLQDELRQRNEQLDRMARVDALTQLYNRRHLQEELHRLGAASRRDQWPLGVVLFDVDHFKQVNDTHGHHSGDLVLQHCARRLLAAARAGDVLGRWGGEEFLLVLPNTDLDEAALAAERMRASVAEAPITVEHTELVVTLSGGCASDALGNVDALVSRADEALYRSKSEGRNRISTSNSTSSP
jgi:two-component system cell cycle response regulator